MTDVVQTIVKKHWHDLSKKPNVVGYSRKLHPKISSNGDKVVEESFRVYVTKKVDINSLRSMDVVTETLEDIPTNVIEIGKLTAPPPNCSPPIKKKSIVDKTVAFRPVKLGVSVGHWSITAGSLGMLYRKDGKIYAGSNAHVLTPNPSYAPGSFAEKRILQPGSYHGGQTEANIVGNYAWHQQIYPVGSSQCKIGKGTSKALNFFPWLFKRVGRFSYGGLGINYIDFAVYEPTIEHIVDVADDSLTDEPFVGHLFAGSETVGIICKSEYIESLGFEPFIKSIDVTEGDKVKGCGFWCNYENLVTDASAAVNVNYGDFTAMIQDCIIMANDGTIRGGYSGSGWRLVN